MPFDWGVPIVVGVLFLISTHAAALMAGGRHQRRRRLALDAQLRQERAFSLELRMRLEKVVRSIDLATTAARQFARPSRAPQSGKPFTMELVHPMAAAIVSELERARKMATEPVA